MSLSKTNDKSQGSATYVADPVFDSRAVRNLIRVGRLGDVDADALEREINDLADAYRWDERAKAELMLPRPKIRPAFKKLIKTIASEDEQLAGLGGILRYEIAKQYGTTKDGLARFHQDVEARYRFKDKIERAEEALEIAVGKTPRDPFFGWLCESMADLYEKFSGEQFTHQRMKGHDNPRHAFASTGGHFAANAIVQIRPETTAAELDTVFANIVKNKKNYSDK